MDDVTDATLVHTLQQMSTAIEQWMRAIAPVIRTIYQLAQQLGLIPLSRRQLLRRARHRARLSTQRWRTSVKAS